MSRPYRGPDYYSLFSYRGLFWHKNILSAVMTVMMLSLAGIPMTLGFIGKFFMIAVSVSACLWSLASAVVVGSAIGMYYYLCATVSLYLIAPEAIAPRHLKQLGVDRRWFAGLGISVYPQPLITLVQMAQPLF